MKTIVKETPAINIKNSNINIINQLLQFKNMQFDTTICLYKKTTKKLNKQLLPIVIQKGEMIYKLSYIKYKHKGRIYESLEYIPIVKSQLQIKSIN